MYREYEGVVSIRPPRGQSTIFGIFGGLFFTSGIASLAFALIGTAKSTGASWLPFVIGPLFALVGICLLWTERAEIDLKRHVVTFRDSFCFITVRRRSRRLPDEFQVALVLWYASARRGRVPHARISLEADGVSHCLFDDAAPHDQAHPAAQALSERLKAPLAITRSKPPLA